MHDNEQEKPDDDWICYGLTDIFHPDWLTIQKYDDHEGLSYEYLMPEQQKAEIVTGLLG